ncbi:4,5-DOPA dioxygenase extradiol [Rodentibacter trehalosifermentans]|uniref:4,5-DOPA dioxygenase extradiol n=1 Tax=Rodentibacter trehalosifermentans TaxID=1908263 RepID=A0A1V3ILG3_9PAST|nr:4,5-DOPA dioxygenase extradiol [Rodentibacter trehalosifermentans]OOF42536.1 4,5-DOPA dioxygenase extradiol [Rodentibacter trehalosifermentans]OOF52783.1 4,5-DOPA dioxygenase extradiol [Rodentibacter trehalosifermentans]
MSNKMPALFVGHGNPMNAIESNNPFNQNFAQVAASFEKPKAILCISAHWFSDRLQVTGSANPPMIYDFYGFPDALSQINYPAPGSAELVARVQTLLQNEELHINPTRGFDHGAWAVLMHLYPQADVPVVQLSLDRSKSAQWHFDLAKKLVPLREEGVLILGSGDIVHNLSVMSHEHINTIGAAYDWALTFRDQINQAVVENNLDALVNFEQFGEPASLSVPTPEHYLPLLYVMALREDIDDVVIFNDVLVGGSVSMTSVLVGNSGLN